MTKKTPVRFWMFQEVFFEQKCLSDIMCCPHPPALRYFLEGHKSAAERTQFLTKNPGLMVNQQGNGSKTYQNRGPMPHVDCVHFLPSSNTCCWILWVYYLGFWLFNTRPFLHNWSKFPVWLTSAAASTAAWPQKASAVQAANSGPSATRSTAFVTRRLDLQLFCWSV